MVKLKHVKVEKRQDEDEEIVVYKTWRSDS